MLTREDLLSKCLLSFVSLKKLNAENLPIDMASGCIVEHNSRHFLLTVFHAVGDQQKWALEIKYEQLPGMQVYLLGGGFTYFKKGDLKTQTLHDIDLAIKELDKTVVPYYQEISLDKDKKIIREDPKIVQRIDFALTPVIEKKYMFAGLTRPAIGGQHHDRYIVQQHLTIEENISFSGTKPDSDIYIFKLARAHPGHEEYKGCSGSPIFDSDGNIVALVVGGDSQKNEIYGINLGNYKIALDIESGAIK
jgi:hypothetical protein